MLFVVSWGLLLAPVWTYGDAARHRIGKVECSKSFFNMSAGAWASCAMLPLPFVPFIAIGSYVLCRNKLIEQAKLQPVTHKLVPLKLMLILAINLALKSGYFMPVSGETQEIREEQRKARVTGYFEMLGIPSERFGL